MRCRSCGDLVDPERVELGYDYCLKSECQQQNVKGVLLAAIGVNKAADHYVRAEEVLPPPSPPTISFDDDEESNSSEGWPARRRVAVAKPVVRSPLARLQEKERELDAGLRRNYERFCRGELTAKEMDRANDKLVRTFNLLVSAENIRYRSMLRKTSDGHR